ncbi:ABC transporter permease [Streptomyces phaeoluteigriseus]|uniref:ABC transporter permease n=1 Tax=Streptomyces phaeoluteigriseus TaxID=114686 RepID=A0ABY4ZEG1_9ACTN|nr:ABC transporter permease [Streptomyces phaeoluteigriseus]USQ86900.1 ABC transporter permease [Streptomyces phaeoluteigriseus]
MTSVVVRGALRCAVSLALVVTASFLMVRLIPGDPVRAALGVDAPPALVAAKRHELGLDQPLATQFRRYVGGLLHGDLGTSLVSGEPVAELVRTRLPATLQLACLAFAVVVAVSVPLGLLAAAATRDGRAPRTELAFTTAASVLAGVPDFVLAAGLTAGLAVGLPLFPVAGGTGASSFVLPVTALSVAPCALLARLVRVEALAVLSQDYMRAARAKRLPARTRYVRHALPNMLVAFLAVAGNLLPGLIAGTALVEKVFAWPGLGSVIAQSVVALDHAVVQAAVLVLGTAVLLANLLVDLALAALDPRSTVLER